MAHYAKVVDGVVETIIVAEADYIAKLEGAWVKTSYNMVGGVYYDPSTKEPVDDQSIISGDEARERKNYAGKGYLYDGTGFYTPKPYESWTLNSNSYLWESPVNYPDDGKDYEWDELNTKWVEINRN